MKSSIKKDLDTLSKNLYLESPDLWIEFLDKVNSGIFDELVLFFATKYNYISIVKYAIDNNLIDINSKSRNKEFATIYDHLVYVARQNNYKDFSDYFSNLKNPNKKRPPIYFDGQIFILLFIQHQYILQDIFLQLLLKDLDLNYQILFLLIRNYPL